MSAGFTRKGRFPMRNSLKNPVRTAAIATLVGCNVASFAPVFSADKKPSEPIVLLFGESPVFLGPHEHWVKAIAFSPDGKTLATGAVDSYLRFWDCATGQLKSIRGDDSTRGFHAVAFSPDGRSVAAVGGLLDKEVVIYDATPQALSRAFDAHGGAFDSEPVATGAAPFLYKGKPIDFRAGSAVAFSPDGHILATAPGGVVLREPTSGKVLATLKQPAKGVKAVTFSPDGKLLATAAEDRKVRLWSMPDGSLVSTCDGPTQALGAVAFSPDGARMAATSNGSRTILDQSPVSYLWVWELPASRARKIELGNVRAGQVAFVSPTTVITCAGRELVSYDLQRDETSHRRIVWSTSKDVLSVAVSPDRSLVACGGEDRTVDLIEFSTGRLVHRLPGLMDRFSAVATSSDGTRFVTATSDRRFSTQAGDKETSFSAKYKTYFSGDTNIGRMQRSEVKIWSAQDGRLQASLPISSVQVTAVRFVPRSDQLAVAGWVPEKGGSLSLWDPKGPRQVRVFPTDAAEILSIAVSPDGATMAAGGADGSLTWWDLKSGANVRSKSFDHAIRSVIFSGDGKLLAVGAGRNISVLDTTAGVEKQRLTSGTPIESVDFSPDGSMVAAGTHSAGLELWDLRSGAAGRALRAPGDYLDTMPGFVAFSTDGRIVAGMGHGKDIAVFDTSTGELQCELRGHGHPATAAAFLPDGRLVSGGEDRTIRLWSPQQRSLLATWVAMPADAARNWNDEWVGFTPAGEFVGSSSLNRLVGWQTGGEIVIGQADAQRRQRIERLDSTSERAVPACK